MENVTFYRKWSTSKDVNVKNQEQMCLVFDVDVFRSTPFPKERHIFTIIITILKKINIYKQHGEKGYVSLLAHDVVSTSFRR